MLNLLSVLKDDLLHILNLFAYVCAGGFITVILMMMLIGPAELVDRGYDKMWLLLYLWIPTLVVGIVGYLWIRSIRRRVNRMPKRKKRDPYDNHLYDLWATWRTKREAHKRAKDSSKWISIK
jgi:general stress protein CsbA